jgi:hypothetical protein
LTVICWPDLVIPTFPVTPVTVGVANFDVIAGHADAQDPVQVLTPELAVSFK